MSGINHAGPAYEFIFYKLAGVAGFLILVIFNKITKNQPCFARFGFTKNQLTAGSVFKVGFVENPAAGDFCF